MPLLFFDLSYQPCLVFEPGQMSFEHPASAIAGCGTYHPGKNVAVFCALEA
jgi:hypothetical protein